MSNIKRSVFVSKWSLRLCGKEREREREKEEIEDVVYLVRDKT